VKIYVGDGWSMDFKQTHFDSYSPPDFYARVRLFNVYLSVVLSVLHHLQDDLKIGQSLPYMPVFKVDLGPIPNFYMVSELHPRSAGLPAIRFLIRPPTVITLQVGCVKSLP
jgi:hypothetical protein